MLSFGGLSRRCAALAAGAVALALWAPAGCVVEKTMKERPAGDPGTDEPANYPASEQCSVFPQAGCPSTHTCQIATYGGATICEGAGQVPQAGYCLTSSDCAVGLSCLYSQCRPHCRQAADCPGPGATCMQVTDSGGQPFNGWMVCSVPCNPADPQNLAGLEGLFACPGGWGCFPTGEGEPGSTECYIFGPGATGSSCEGTGDCQPGNICLTDSSAGTKTCEPLCVFGLTGCSCQPFAEPFYVAMPSGLLEVGWCL